MKTLLLLFFAFTITNWILSQEPIVFDYEIKKTDTGIELTETDFLANCTLVNNTIDTICLLSISCHDYESLIKTNNKKLNYQYWMHCYRSIPVKVKIPPKDTVLFSILLSYTGKVKKMKEMQIGFVLNQIDLNMDISKLSLLDVEKRIDSSSIIWRKPTLPLK